MEEVVFNPERDHQHGEALEQAKMKHIIEQEANDKNRESYTNGIYEGCESKSRLDSLIQEVF